MLLVFSMGAMWPLVGKIGLWITDVAGFSLLLALIEIVIEKDRGWASGLSESGWGRKLLAGTAAVRWIDKPYITSYHLLVFGTLLPVALLSEYRVGIPAVFGRAAGAGPAIAEFLFLLSAFLAITVLEDFLWFVLNWYYPQSLTDLFGGEIWWHTGWVALGRSVKLPRFYLSVGAMALGLLAVSVVLAR